MTITEEREMAPTLTKDHALVLLDAITIARQQAPATNYSPWNDYPRDEYGDDKATQAGWYDLLNEAAEILQPLSTDDRLSLIGRERVLIAQLAKRLHDEARRHHAYGSIQEIPRGNAFELRLADGRVAKVTVELDRVEEEH